jgi:hypothetical protein
MNIVTKSPRALNLNVMGGVQYGIDQIRAVPTPQKTDTWTPIAHGSLVDEFTRQAKSANLEIVDSLHTLARPVTKGKDDGQRYFGLFHVRGINRANNDDIGTVIGLRNSHDKAFAASIMAGDAPFVCTNLIFSNEIVLGRKHTTFITRDLPQLISRAIGKLGSHWSRQDERIESYRAAKLTDAEAHDLTIRAFRNGAISKTQIANVVGQWHAPEHDEFSDRNGWSLYNAFTNVYRGNLPALGKRSDALHGTLDLAFGVNGVN